ncbi:MAG: hypothetical protein J6J93_08645 [Muribaculaceae bacterium]|nr:hypothetical protein [Muribaculaceae bacterium]
MKKKFINGLLLLAVASFSCSTFTSCKDTDDDLRAEWSQSDQKLQKLYDDLKAAQEKCCNDIKGFLAPYLKDDNTLQKVLDGYATDDDIKDMVTTDMLGAKTPEEFQEWVESVAEALTSINNYQNIGAHLTTLMTEYEANQKAGITNSDLDKRIADLEKEFHITEKQWTDAQATLKIVEDNKDGIVWVHNNLAYLQTLQTLIGNWGEGVEGTASIAEKIRELIADCQQLNSRLETAEDDIKTLKADLLKLQNQVATLQNRLDLLVTSLLVQGTFNPLFGNFSLPIGIQSNMVVNYYGKSLKDSYSFPNAPEAATVDTKDVLTADELAVLQASGMTAYPVENGAMLMNPSLGKVYMTINPNNVDYHNVEMSLVNSQDDPSPVKLENLRPSDAVLTFGYSRAEDKKNGFFEADAVVDETNVEEAALHIDQSLKTSMKNILKDGRNNLRSNVVALMKAVYDQFNGFLPAYGLKAAWTVEEKVLDENGVETGETVKKDYATYSNYNIAATTFKPLSFGFLYGESFNHKLPTIDPISQSIINIEEIKDKINFKFDFEFELSGTPNFSIDFGDFDLAYDGKDIELDLSEVKVLDKEGNEIGRLSGKVALTGEDLKPLFDSLNEQLEEQFGTLSEDIKTQFQNAIQEVYNKVNKEVNDMLAEMEGNINEQVKDMIDDILGDATGKLDNYIGKFNSFINRYNSLADRLNAYLENPNHFLQPTMFYNAVNGGDYFLSNNPAQPTVFKNNGGSGVTVYATTYTAEVLAPAFKKVVAVANVLGADGKPVADAVAQASAINKAAAGVLATVVDGSRKRFVIPTADMKPGLTYEILYTALDYHGVTATQRFYITVE